MIQRIHLLGRLALEFHHSPTLAVLVPLYFKILDYQFTKPRSSPSTDVLSLLVAREVPINLGEEKTRYNGGPEEGRGTAALLQTSPWSGSMFQNYCVYFYVEIYKSICSCHNFRATFYTRICMNLRPNPMVHWSCYLKTQTLLPPSLRHPIRRPQRVRVSHRSWVQGRGSLQVLLLGGLNFCRIQILASLQAIRELMKFYH